MKMKNIYICCPKHLKPTLRAEAELRFQNLYVVKDQLDEADMVYAIGEVTTSMEREIVQANRNGIPIIYASEKFRNETVYDGLLSNKKRVQVIAKEKTFERER